MSISLPNTMMRLETLLRIQNGVRLRQLLLVNIASIRLCYTNRCLVLAHAMNKICELTTWDFCAISLMMLPGHDRMINFYGQPGARMMTRENLDQSPFRMNGGLGFYCFSAVFLGLPVIRMWQMRIICGDGGNIRDGGWPQFRGQLEKEWSSATLFVRLFHFHSKLSV